jgi:hypothetical protein
VPGPNAEDVCHLLFSFAFSFFVSPAEYTRLCLKVNGVLLAQK